MEKAVSVLNRRRRESADHDGQLAGHKGGMKYLIRVVPAGQAREKERVEDSDRRQSHHRRSVPSRWPASGRARREYLRVEGSQAKTTDGAAGAEPRGSSCSRPRQGVLALPAPEVALALALAEALVGVPSS